MKKIHRLSTWTRDLTTAECHQAGKDLRLTKDEKEMTCEKCINFGIRGYRK